MASRALELDPSNGSAHWLLALDSIKNWDYEAAELRLTSAIAANPSDTSLIFPYVDLLFKTGRLELAMQEARRGVEIEPLIATLHALLGSTLLVLGNHQAAIDSFEYALTLGPVVSGVWARISIAYHQAGRDVEALEAMVRRSPPSEQAMRTGFAENGWEGMSLAFAKSVGYPTEGCPAPLLAMAGMTEQMYQCLERVLNEHLGEGPYLLNASPSLAPYREETRFRALINRMTEIRKSVAAGAGSQ